MRFDNAAGFKQSVGEKPWYSTDSKPSVQEETISKDVWGNEDPRRKERGKMRMAAEDPLAAIQRGVQGVRKAEKDRKRWREEKGREIEDLISLAKRKARRGERHSRRQNDDVEAFSLDTTGFAQDVKDQGRHRRHRNEHGGDHGSRRRHRHRHRDRSRSMIHHKTLPPT